MWPMPAAVAPPPMTDRLEDGDAQAVGRRSAGAQAAPTMPAADDDDVAACRSSPRIPQQNGSRVVEDQRRLGVDEGACP